MRPDGGTERPSTPRRGRWSQAEQARLKQLYGLREDAAIARELNRPVASVRKMAEKLFPLRRKSGPWSGEEVAKLKHYYGGASEEVIARVLGRSVQEVREQVKILERTRRQGPWTREETAEFKRIYGRRRDEDLATVFGRPVEEIRKRAVELALAKDKAFLRRLKGESATRMPRWKPHELELLQREYAEKSNLEIARKLNRSVKSVVSKAHHLGLKKSAERLQNMGRENVNLRYRDS